MPEKYVLYLNFYSSILRFETDTKFVYENIRRDFEYFIGAKRKPDVTVKAFCTEFPQKRLPKIKAAYYNFNSVTYDSKNKRYVTYSGGVVSIYDFSNEKGNIYSKNEKLLYEVTYLMIQSRIGELLDKKGIHRVHALGFTYLNKAVLLLLPQGAGKSTLCLQLLKKREIKLLSDDTPLITRKGTVLPFPIRIGVSSLQDVKKVPKKFVRAFFRQKYGVKWLIDIAYFKKRLSEAAPLGVLMIGQRLLSGSPRIRKISKLKCVPWLMQSLVFGMGVPQVFEYFFKVSLKGILQKFPILFLRFYVCLVLLIKSETYTMLLSPDRAANVELLFNFLRKKEAVKK